MNTSDIDLRTSDDPRSRTRSPLPNYHAEASLAHSSEDRHDSLHMSSRPSTTGKLTKKRPTHGHDWKQIRQHNLPPRMRANSSASSSGHGHTTLSYPPTPSPTQATFPVLPPPAKSPLTTNSTPNIVFVDPRDPPPQDVLYRSDAGPPKPSVAPRPRTAVASHQSRSNLPPPTLAFSPPPPVDGHVRQQHRQPQSLPPLITPTTSSNGGYTGGNPLTTPSSYLQPQPLAVVHHHHHHHHYHSPESDSGSSSTRKMRSNSVSTTASAGSSTSSRPARNLPPRLMNKVSTPDLAGTGAVGTKKQGTSGAGPLSSITTTDVHYLHPQESNEYVEHSQQQQHSARSLLARNAIPAYHSHLMNLRLTSPVPKLVSNTGSRERLSKGLDDQGEDTVIWKDHGLERSSQPPPPSLAHNSRDAPNAPCAGDVNGAVSGTGSALEPISKPPMNATTLRRNGSIRRPAGSGSLRLRRHSALLHSTLEDLENAASPSALGSGSGSSGMGPVKEIEQEHELEEGMAGGCENLDHQNQRTPRPSRFIPDAQTYSHPHSQAYSQPQPQAHEYVHSAPASASSCETGETGETNATSYESQAWETGTWESESETRTWESASTALTRMSSGGGGGGKRWKEGLTTVEMPPPGQPGDYNWFAPSRSLDDHSQPLSHSHGHAYMQSDWNDNRSTLVISNKSSSSSSSWDGHQYQQPRQHQYGGNASLTSTVTPTPPSDAEASVRMVLTGLDELELGLHGNDRRTILADGRQRDGYREREREQDGEGDYEGEMDQGSVADHGHGHRGEHEERGEWERGSDPRVLRGLVGSADRNKDRGGRHLEPVSSGGMTGPFYDRGRSPSQHPPATPQSQSLAHSHPQPQPQPRPQPSRRTSWWKDPFGSHPTSSTSSSSTPVNVSDAHRGTNPTSTPTSAKGGNVGVIGDKIKKPIRPSLTPTQSSERFVTPFQAEIASSTATAQGREMNHYFIPQHNPRSHRMSTGVGMGPGSKAPGSLYLPNPSFDPFRSEIQDGVA